MSEQLALSVPYGCDDLGALVAADDATKGRHYTCPACNERLTLRAGEVRVKHFSHAPSSNCSPEHVLHKTAKMLVARSIRDNAAGRKLILLWRGCHACGIEYQTELPPGTFSSAKEEVGISSFVCDVIGYRGNTPALAIEIRHTHQVGERKANELEVPWVELQAENVMESPADWHVLEGRLKGPQLCTDCAGDPEHIQTVADKWGIDRYLYTPFKDPTRALYIAETFECFKCHEEIPVFWWQGVPFCETEPPLPRPKTIKNRYSKMWDGRYWANTCAACGVIQGDNYVFRFGGSPFLGCLPMQDDYEEDNEPGTGAVRIVSEPNAAKEMYKVLDRILPRVKR